MRILWIIMIVWVAMLMMTGSGCNEAQQQTKVWGQGELSPEWRSFFGNGNISRLGFVQTQAINQHQAIIYGTDVRDPNGAIVRKRGLVERITTLESIIDRVKKLEDTASRLDYR